MRWLCLWALLIFPVLADDALQQSIAQLRHVIGQWQVRTEFLNTDGSVAKAIDGRYTFDWVIPDRLIFGQSVLPELEQVSALLFYLRETSNEIEMVSVGRDGKLWVMTGPLGGETRTTAPTITAEGKSLQLRFTRYNVSADRFESKMEYSVDNGQTWLPGNHQVFERKKP